MGAITRREFSKLAAVGAATVAAGGLLAEGGVLVPQQAHAVAPSMLVAAYPDGAGGVNLFRSVNGTAFTKVGSFDGGGVSFATPGIIYQSGAFWLLGAEPDGGEDGKLHLNIAASRDLRHWCNPRELVLDVPEGVIGNGEATSFDVVGCSWCAGYFDDVHLTVSLGFCKDRHGGEGKNALEVYIMNFEALAAADAFDPAADPAANGDDVLTITPRSLRKAAFPERADLPGAAANRGCPSMFYENKSSDGNNTRFYLVDTADDAVNELWRIDDYGYATSAAQWREINLNIAPGYTSPSIAVLGSRYSFYVFNDRGVLQVMQATAIDGPYSVQNLIYPTFADAKGGAMDAPTAPGNLVGLSDDASKAVVDAALAAEAASTPDPEPDAPEFVDVPADAYYAEAVAWAVQNGITTGYERADGKLEFRPNSPCTRAQVVTFLHRASAKAAATGPNPFVDVPESSYFAEHVKWALASKITTGKDDTHFAPNDPCTRAQVVTFLYRSVPGHTMGPIAKQFTDVPEGAYYAEAVKWAVSNGITTGNSDTTFNPNGTCTRAQVVTFLYRTSM